MSVFPARILLSKDGSEDAELAMTTAVGLTRITGSELCVVTVFPESAYVYAYYAACPVMVVPGEEAKEA
jgi:nucleotide-binding universal stress UspA family protein